MRNTVEHVDNKPYFYPKKRKKKEKRRKKKTRDSFKAASFDIVGVSKFTLDECRPGDYFAGLKLGLKDKNGDTIDWIRLADEQGVPLINVIW